MEVGWREGRWREEGWKEGGRMEGGKAVRGQKLTANRQLGLSGIVTLCICLNMCILQAFTQLTQTIIIYSVQKVTIFTVGIKYILIIGLVDSVRNIVCYDHLTLKYHKFNIFL